MKKLLTLLSILTQYYLSTIKYNINLFKIGITLLIIRYLYPSVFNYFSGTVTVQTTFKEQLIIYYYMIFTIKFIKLLGLILIMLLVKLIIFNII